MTGISFRSGWADRYRWRATLLEKHGTMNFEQVLAPAIEYAEQGFPVSEIIAADWDHYGAAFADDRDFARAYLVDKKAPAHGDVFVNPNLAKTLREIAKGWKRGVLLGGTDPRKDGAVAAW